MGRHSDSSKTFNVFGACQKKSSPDDQIIVPDSADESLQYEAEIYSCGVGALSLSNFCC
jgi:hypothetical protein